MQFYIGQFNYLIYYTVLTVVLLLLTYWITRRLALRKMKRVVMKAEHNYQQQIIALQMQLSGKVNIFERKVDGVNYTVSYKSGSSHTYRLYRVILYNL